MTPPPGERLVKFVGDYIRFTLRFEDGLPKEPGWRAFVRTNIGRAKMRREEIIKAHFEKIPLFGASWHDVPMRVEGDKWVADIPLTEVGYFRAKAYVRNPKGWQHWPAGPDFGLSVHPDSYRTGNTIYCAFTRLFGASKCLVYARDDKTESALTSLDKLGYTVIPTSGKLRDLKRELPHIVQRLGCKVLHLLPINPTPTTYARFGRMGSPYAALDLTAIDPALVEFDKKTTGVDQFKELTYEAHKLGARVFLDIVINHTGWGAYLQENHPEWYKRNRDGTFESPGAWGNIWADLVELDQKYPELWECFAEAFLTWCRRGVDGFRCDAGYKVPVNVWQYIVARVQEEFPETIFLLEGLGGAWEATEELLTEGGMQWAYSELFQNYNALEVSRYLDHSIRQSSRVGILVHYSETHDNNRLALKGRQWSLLRNRLCGLTSICGGFGFTCGVEWLAVEKINVHNLSGLAWGNPGNIIEELSRINKLLREHPCFFDGAKLTRLSPNNSPVYALLRISEEGKDAVLVLVNTDTEHQQLLSLPFSAVERIFKVDGQKITNPVELLGQQLPELRETEEGKIEFKIPGGAVYCLSATATARGLWGDNYRRLRACSAFGFQALNRIIPAEQIPVLNWRELGEVVYKNPEHFLSSLLPEKDLIELFKGDFILNIQNKKINYPYIIEWDKRDVNRIVPVPANHWIVIKDNVPFRACITIPGEPEINLQSIEVSTGYISAYLPSKAGCDALIRLERYGGDIQEITGKIRLLPSIEMKKEKTLPRPDSIALLTNGRGGMARICVNLGEVRSKYDCVIGANLHPQIPVDRHIFVKRVRAWVNADGFLTPLNWDNCICFDIGDKAEWRFVSNAGDGRAVEIRLSVWMEEQRNTTVLRFLRPDHHPSIGKELPQECDVSLTVRFDIEDRNFHTETKRNEGAEYHFGAHTRELKATFTDGTKLVGFEFTPSPERQLRVWTTKGKYHPSPEWSVNIPHPVEQTRGLVASGDGYSPGWFELPIKKGESITLVVTAETVEPFKTPAEPPQKLKYLSEADFKETLVRAIRHFIVKRGNSKTVIAGYPWFLDWGRDTLICACGLVAAGMIEEVKSILALYGSFEKDGTLPNAIFGENTANRDTSDAPLWFALVCEEVERFENLNRINRIGPVWTIKIENQNRTIRDVLGSIAINYIKGTPNGIKMDEASGLIFSPSHFTWMDTNYPACTPREGYPIEIQALWIRLLRLLDMIGFPPLKELWSDIAMRAQESLNTLYWLEDKGWFSDVLLAKPGVPARLAIKDNALRSNCLIPISLGIIRGERARKCVESARRYLVVPGGLRSLAPLPVDPPLAIYSSNNVLLNDPHNPYWGHYEGEEDTRRKPAYHNGTAWVWKLSVFCEALVYAYNLHADSVSAARAYMLSLKPLLEEGCIGQLPEILDGDAPHTQRGCDAQSWSVTEAYRVWKFLDDLTYNSYRYVPGGD